MTLALGIDIGGTHTKIGLVNPAGEINAFRRIPTDARGQDPGPYLENLIATARTALTESDAPMIGVGLSAHGHWDDARRTSVLCENTPALQGLEMAKILEDAFGLPVVINNDLTAHALAEYVYGSGAGVRRFMVMAIGTGLGVGVIVNGEPLRYIEGTPGDSGRIILEPDAPPDVLGVRGSAEGLCGVAGIERLAAERYGREMRAFEVIQAAQKGDDPVATAIMTQIGTWLGKALALLSPVFLPNKIALTGGTTEAGPVLLNAVRTQFDAWIGDYHRTLSREAPAYYSEIEIVIGEMRGETGVVGAVVELFQNAGLITSR